MKNSDFRKLLDTPARVQPASPAATMSPAAEEGEKPKKKQKKFYKPQADKAEKAASAYRDRAAERRKGGDEPEEEFATMPLTADESKFLGGDVEHTHLVKGLDVALLEKVRAEQAAAAAKREIVEAFGSDSDDEPGTRVDDGLESLGQRISALLDEKKQPAASRTAAALFAPGRMAYLFDLDAAANVPTMELRAMASWSKNVARRSMAAIPQVVIDEVANIIAYGAGGSGKNRIAQRLPPQESPTTVAPQVTLLQKKRPIVDEEKIFSESSDEEAETKKQKTGEEEEVAPVVQKGAYFGAAKESDKGADALAQVLGVSATKVEAAARAMVQRKQAEKRRAEEQAARAREAAARDSAAPGAYAAYLQRTAAAGVVVEKEIDAEEEAKRTRFVVEEGDEVDDEAILKQYRSTLEPLAGDEKGKGKGKGKQGDKKKHKTNHDKMKTDQAMEKIEKLMAAKRETAE